ncbi:hypothetical protein SDC9_104987 [bioreactor metagenome]|uniref:Uncharacterized protein n=1 Tax=bioreactor metagenome TaxID=1076179 RepID=A0A645AZE5_9ZZZZ
MKRKKTQPWAGALLAVVLSLALCPVALADTDGTEPKITQKPDQLVLQLGARWAGVEFELRTDAGIFPVPVVVDASGVLRMDLGGSTTYTLSCMESTIPIPDPAPPTTEQNPAQEGQTPLPQQPAAKPTPAEPRQGIPTTHLLLFLAALAVGVGGLVAFFLARRRRLAEESEWDEDEESL